MASPAMDAVDRYVANRTTVKGYTNAELQAALEASNKANPQAGGLAPVNVDFSGTPGYSTDAAGAAATDWSAYLDFWNLPPDLKKELDSIFRNTPDVNQAIAKAQAYVRGTPWYAQTYPGIQNAIAKGLVRDEAGYRALQNQFNQVYRQYNNGQELSAGEYAGYLGEGISADTLARRFQGAALTNVEGNDWQYLEGNFGEGRLSDTEKSAYGQQRAGIDSELGLRVQRRLQMAQERIRSVFSGTLATNARFAQPLAEKSGIPSDIAR
jgi:hypothetical protein